MQGLGRPRSTELGCSIRRRVHIAASYTAERSLGGPILTWWVYAPVGISTERYRQANMNCVDRNKSDLPLPSARRILQDFLSENFQSATACLSTAPHRLVSAKFPPAQILVVKLAWKLAWCGLGIVPTTPFVAPISRRALLRDTLKTRN